MNLYSHARTLAFKYAEFLSLASNGDSSLGGLVTPEKVLILKEKLSEVYDKLSKDITTLPNFIRINQIFKHNPHLKTLNELLEDYADFIAENNLKECFSYSIRLIEVLNALRNDIKDLPRKKLFEFESIIKSIQDHIWKESKRILNLHDLRGANLNLPEDIVDGGGDSFIPTWDYGPGKNPAYNKPKRRLYETPNQMMKRLMKENEQEAKKDKK